MGRKLKLKKKELLAMGYPKGKVIGLAIHAANELNRTESSDYVRATLKRVVSHPDAFREDAHWGKVAAHLLDLIEQESETSLRPNARSFPIFGEAEIDEATKTQMFTAMRLPISVAGALMPDAHLGYGLPIGGVLATEGAVIPYAVGVDIGCRMALSLFDIPLDLLHTDRDRFKGFLRANSRFGTQVFDHPFDDPIFERAEFKYIRVARDLRDRAYRQIGSSGSGNHFVEFGTVDLTDPSNEFGLPTGSYLGLLTHSGSRGLGAKIADHYTRLAMRMTRLPKSARELAWLPLSSQEGQEYWAAMTLAGDYASACHTHIHRRMADALGTQPLAKVENHHNFAWSRTLADGRQVIIHRKGATPAEEGVLGIIPGSMTAPGFLVRGKGASEALYSASHGAGRQLSRRAAKQEVKPEDVQRQLKVAGVALIGGGLDEAPGAYKDIHAVMAHQTDLVDVVGRFQPRIVRMAGG